MRWLLLKDLRILRRSPLLVALLVLYPIILAALVGFAITSAPGKPRVALVNEVPPEQNTVSLGGQPTNLLQTAKPLFSAIHVVHVASEQEAIEKVRDGDVLGALVLPADITERVAALASGSGEPATVRVYYNADDPAKKDYVENTIKARVQDADVALSREATSVALGYLNLIGQGGSFSFLGRTFDVLGLTHSAQILRSAEAALPARSPVHAQVAAVARFAQLAEQNLGLAGPLLESVGNPIRVNTTIVRGGAPPLGAFAAAVSATVTLMLITLLLASGALALEREENAFTRLVRGLVGRTGLVVEKTGLAAICSTAVAIILVLALSLFVGLAWSRFVLWVVALVLSALAFGALGTAMGAFAREVRAATLLAIMASLPIAVLALVPSGAVSGGLYSAIRVVSAAFPFRATLDALDSALGSAGGIGLPLLHLAILTAVFIAIARLAIRRLAD